MRADGTADRSRISNIVAFAPMPSANVSASAALKAGCAPKLAQRVADVVPQRVEALEHGQTLLTVSCRGEQLRANFLERAEPPQRFGFSGLARQPARDQRVRAHGEVEANLVVRLDLDGATATDWNAERSANARRQHRR